MARLAAVEKALYYPTNEPVVGLISRCAHPHAKRILDIAVGEGTAVSMLAKAWGLEAYGVELDRDRAAIASQKLYRCLQGSYHTLSATEKAFGVLFLNPPYDAGQDAEGKSIRQEIQFLQDALKWLAPGGLLIYIPPEHILHNSRFQDLIKRGCRDITCYRFPFPFYSLFKQHVLFARKTLDPHSYGYFTPQSEYPVLDPNQFQYGAVRAMEAPLEEFRLTGRPPELRMPARGEEPKGCYALPQWRAIVDGGREYELRPLLPLRPGHRALLLAAGCLDGTELHPGLLVKGSSEKVITTREDYDAEKVFESERIVSRLSTLNLASGELTAFRTDEDAERTAKWFEDNGDALADVVARSYPPAFHGDLDRISFDGLRAPGILPGRTEPEILPIQKQAAAAIAWWWESGQRSAVISGEMGTGKTTMGSVACALWPHAKKVVITCPGHLAKKWLRETQIITGARTMIGKRLSDVDRFFADSSCKFLVLPKDTAKLGARWRPAYIKRKMRIGREVQLWEESWGRQIPAGKEIVFDIVEAVACPRCGALQMNPDFPEHPASEEDFTKEKKKCSDKKCKEPLWQSMPLSARGTRRWAPAKYINQRYSGKYVVVADELHQYAAGDSDQSRALQLLVAGAIRFLGMTGTLYGGRASSIFHILYKVDFEFRQIYRFDATREFVEHHGLFETVTPLDEYTSTYGNKRGNTGGRVREIPGASPSMIKLLLNYTIFVRLTDLGVKLPPFRESVEVLDHDPDVLAAAQALLREVQPILREHPRILGQYLQSCLGYPDCPEQKEEIQERDKYTKKLSGPILASAPAFPSKIRPKDRRVVEIVADNKARGRKVLVYFTQVHRRDAMPRVQAALEAEGFKVAILSDKVSPGDREEWVEKAVADGIDVLFTNGKLVETGLDLLWAKTIIQYGTEYSIHTLRQSTRRSWRLGQTEEIEVIYLAYKGTAQEPALALIAKKMRAAELIDGEEAGGLAQHDEGGHDFFLELAREVTQRGWAPVETRRRSRERTY